MLSGLISAVLVLLFFLLQSAVFPAIAPVHLIPNLLIILTASKGFMKGENTGILVGFFCGLLVDVFFGGVIGFHALLYLYIGFLNGKFSQVFYPEDIKLPLALITVSDLTYGLLCYVFLFLIWGKLEFPYYFAHVILPEMIVTLIATLLFYPPILKLQELLFDRQGKRSTDFV